MKQKPVLLGVLAFALTTSAFAATQTICSGGSVPAGWIKVDHRFSAVQCTPSSFRFNVTVLESFFDKPAKATLIACWNSGTPAGWVTVDKLFAATQCTDPAIYRNTKKIYKVASTDLQLAICHDSPIPAGWIQTNDAFSAVACLVSPPLFDNTWVISRFDNKPIGTTMEVCSDAATPTGWSVTNTGWRATQCHHTSGKIKVIKRIR